MNWGRSYSGGGALSYWERASLAWVRLHLRMHLIFQGKELSPVAMLALLGECLR